MSKLKDKKILIAEDDANFRDVLLLSLQQKGAFVTAAKHGKEALDFFETGSFDIILSDVQMPHMTGVQLLQKIRERDPVVPLFVLLTGHAHVNEEECRSMGAAALVYKPFKLGELITLVESHIDSASK